MDHIPLPYTLRYGSQAFVQPDGEMDPAARQPSNKQKRHFDYFSLWNSSST